MPLLPLLLLVLLALLPDPAQAKRWPFSLGVRDSIMIAHSFKGAEFGPAQSVSTDGSGGRASIDHRSHIDHPVDRCIVFRLA